MDVAANPYKRWVEETTFRSALGDCGGKAILDLCCGSGHWCRLLKSWGADSVGLDASDAMIADARRFEEEDPVGVSYARADLSAGDAPAKNFDIVVAAYANLKDKRALRTFYTAAARALRPGGRFVAITSLYRLASFPALPDAGPGGVLANEPFGVSCAWDGDSKDGMLVDLTFLSQDRQVTLANHLWSQAAISEALLAAGFTLVDWRSSTADGDAPPSLKKALRDKPVAALGFFTAYLPP